MYQCHSSCFRLFHKVFLSLNVYQEGVRDIPLRSYYGPWLVRGSRSRNGQDGQYSTGKGCNCCHSKGRRVSSTEQLIPWSTSNGHHYLYSHIIKHFHYHILFIQACHESAILFISRVYHLIQSHIIHMKIILVSRGKRFFILSKAPHRQNFFQNRLVGYNLIVS